MKHSSNLYRVIIECSTNPFIKKKFIEIYAFFLEIYAFFDFLEKNVCLNFTTQTSKYRLDVSQLSHQCFTGVLLNLLSKKSKHFFFEIDQKNHISSFSWKFQIRSWESLDNENKRLLKKKSWKSVNRRSQT